MLKLNSILNSKPEFDVFNSSNFLLDKVLQLKTTTRVGEIAKIAFATVACVFIIPIDFVLTSFKFVKHINALSKYKAEGFHLKECFSIFPPKNIWKKSGFNQISNRFIAKIEKFSTNSKIKKIAINIVILATVLLTLFFDHLAYSFTSLNNLIKSKNFSKPSKPSIFNATLVKRLALSALALESGIIIFKILNSKFNNVSAPIPNNSNFSKPYFDFGLKLPEPSETESFWDISIPAKYLLLHVLIFGYSVLSLAGKKRELVIVERERNRAIQQQGRAILDRNEAINDRDQAIQQQGRAILDRNEAINDRDQAIQQQGRAILDRNEAINDRDQAIQRRNRAILDRNQAMLQCYLARNERDQAILERDQVAQREDDAIANLEIARNKIEQLQRFIYQKASESSAEIAPTPDRGTAQESQIIKDLKVRIEILEGLTDSMESYIKACNRDISHLERSLEAVKKDLNLFELDDGTMFHVDDCCALCLSSLKEESDLSTEIAGVDLSPAINRDDKYTVVIHRKKKDNGKVCRPIAHTDCVKQTLYKKSNKCMRCHEEISLEELEIAKRVDLKKLLGLPEDYFTAEAHHENLNASIAPAAAPPPSQEYQGTILDPKGFR